MEIVSVNLPRRSDPAATVGIPFNKRNVEEWSRLDRLTGMMEKAKIETDHWAASTTTSAHKYGKMVDSRERNNPDGSLQQRQRKQMEVFQSQVPGGSMQVIRTQTVTSSSSKWAPAVEKGFEDLQLPINPLDLSSQKTKGSVGRSGSIGSRRPPSRPRSLIGQTSSSALFGEATRLCQQLHQEATRTMFGGSLHGVFGHGTDVFNGKADSEDEGSGVVIEEVTDSAPQRSNLSRQKSCSNENMTVEEEDENMLRRTSKVRRSLQFPKRNEWNVQDNDISPGKSLKERAAEIENLLRRGSSTTTTASQDSDRWSSSSERQKPLKPRDSFVTVETLKEVRDRLKKAGPEGDDDGIVTEKDESSRVKSFVYGVEAMLGSRKSVVNGTRSLESRSSSKSSTNGTRSAEWYRRRKSYGFEHVDESEKFDKFNKKQNIESSTDSGICQSSETVETPAWVKILADKKDAPYPRSTIVTLGPKVESGDSPSVTPVASQEDTRRHVFRRYTEEALPCEAVWNRKSPLPIPRKTDVRESLKSSLRSAKNPWISQLRGTKLVDRKWISDEYDSEENDDEGAEKQDGDGENGGQKKHKKVEFCKTEVHFAAESGKFNIVETDGKPPPTDIFKRRRRNSGPTLLKNTSGLPETKFGDSPYEKKLLASSEDKTESISDKIEAELQELSRLVIDALPPKDPESAFKTTATLPKLYDVEEENDESQKPRSILKNYRKSYLLGDPEGEEGERVPPVWKSTVILRNKRFDDVRKRNTEDGKLYSSDGESELQMRFRSLRKTDSELKRWDSTARDPADSELKRRSLPDDFLTERFPTVSVSTERPPLSVAERIKQVEELKSNNYSTKINFRSGEMTVVQNGSEVASEEHEAWRPTLYDDKRTSNPSVTRFSNNKNDKTDSQQYQTTRILINLKSAGPEEGTGGARTAESAQSAESEPRPGRKPSSSTSRPHHRPSYPHSSWTSGMQRDLRRHCQDLKSTSLVIRTLHSQEPQTEQNLSAKEDIPKSSKPVCEIVQKFDSLSLPKRITKERRRKTMPINYKAPKEYTHADLEEELRNFTDNLDKDFKDIYDREIGCLKQMSSKKVKEVLELEALKSMGNAKGSQGSSRCNYDSEDSDVLADEEVRSYMSTGHGGTDSEEEAPGSWSSRASQGTKPQVNGYRDNRDDVVPIKAVPSYPPATATYPKIASIALRYEDDPTFSKTNFKSSIQISKSTHKDTSDLWERASNSSSTYSDKPRERVSYLNGTSLSEKYSRRSSNSSLEAAPETPRTRIVPIETKPEKSVTKSYGKDRVESKMDPPRRTVVDTFQSSLTKEAATAQRSRNGAEPGYRRRTKERDEADSAILEELTRAADQILMAVNGYTDDDSHLASSEDDDKTRRIIRRDKLGNLATIAEGKRVTKTESRKATTLPAVKKGNQSSASSLESLHKETTRVVRARDTKPSCPRLKQKESTKPLSSRATRLLQRASSREALFAQPSSSEDIPSYVELSKKRNVRRHRTSTTIKADTETRTTCSRLRLKSKDTEVAPSRIRDRKPTVAKDPSKEPGTVASRSKPTQSASERTNSRRVESISRRTGDKTTDSEPRKKRTPLYAAEEQTNMLAKKRTTRVNVKKVECSRSKAV